jgi:membrane-bound lytic murein transglycosylase MltF
VALRTLRWVIVIFISVASLCVACEARGQIPDDAPRYRNLLTRQARLVWGLNAPISTFAAQIHQESGWRADARSHVGAAGLTQFMPQTAAWIAQEFPEALSSPEPLNPAWAIRAMVRYMQWLYDRVHAVNHCERMAFALSSYNGGLGNLNKEIREADARGLDGMRWFGHVEKVNKRAEWAWKENRGYPLRILKVLEPRYHAAGWGAKSC